VVEQLLLVLKIAFVVLLYLFIWRIIRSASRDLAVGQESMVLAPMRPPAPSATERPHRVRAGRLVVARSPELAEGSAIALDRELVAGRAGTDIALGADGYASARHARFRPLDGDGAVVEDLRSTNGTFVNGERVDGPRRLEAGDVVTIGQTQLRYER
jgi:pSer/pThr/pTyr-binding forkhead associated (FHA) protein